MPTFKRFLLLFLKQLQPEIPMVETSKHKEPPLMSSTITSNYFKFPFLQIQGNSYLKYYCCPCPFMKNTTQACLKTEKA